MDITIFSIDSIGIYFYFWVLVAVAFIFGISIYYGMRKPRLRRLWHKTFFDFDEPPISKRCAIVAGLAIALPFMINAYVETWHYFYKVNQDGEQLHLYYLFPKQTIELVETKKLRIGTQYEVRRGYRIIIENRGHSYSSQIMDRQEAKENLAKLNNALRPYRGL